MKRMLAVVLFAAFAGISHPEPPSCHATPTSFCRVFQQIDATISQTERESLRSATEQQIGAMHHGFGAATRNSLRLWEDNELTRYFRSIGVDHADMMSGVVVRGYVAYLNGREVNIPSIAQSRFPPPVPPEPASGR